MDQQELFNQFLKFQLANGGGIGKGPVRENFGASPYERQGPKSFSREKKDCRYADSCKNVEECPFKHPKKPVNEKECRYADSCKNVEECPFKHPLVNLAQKQIDEERKFLISRLAMLDSEKAQSSAPAKAPAKAKAPVPAKTPARVHFDDEVAKAPVPAKTPAPAKAPAPKTAEEKEFEKLTAEKAALIKAKELNELAKLKAEIAALKESASK